VLFEIYTFDYRRGIVSPGTSIAGLSAFQGGRHCSKQTKLRVINGKENQYCGSQTFFNQLTSHSKSLYNLLHKVKVTVGVENERVFGAIGPSLLHFACFCQSCIIQDVFLLIFVNQQGYKALVNVSGGNGCEIDWGTPSRNDEKWMKSGTFMTEVCQIETQKSWARKLSFEGEQQMCEHPQPRARLYNKFVNKLEAVAWH